LKCSVTLVWTSGETVGVEEIKIQKFSFPTMHPTPANQVELSVIVAEMDAATTEGRNKRITFRIRDRALSAEV
jgi:hypothetical protein